MSRKQQHHEALRWLTTAREDLAAAILLKEQGMFSHSCFLAQQCAEKAIKALWYEIDEEPWGHSVQKLLQDLPSEEHREQLHDLLSEAATLDRFYIPARYPNGLPDLTPGTTFVKSDAELSCANAQRILDEAARIIDEGGNSAGNHRTG